MGFISCSTWTQLPHSIWNLPRAQIEPLSPALAEFLTPDHQGSLVSVFWKCSWLPFSKTIEKMVAGLPLELHYDFLIQHSVTFSWKGCFNLGTKRWVSIILIRVMTSKKKKKKRIAERVSGCRLSDWVLLLIIPCHPSFWKTNSFSAELQFTGGGGWPRASFTQSKDMRGSGLWLKLATMECGEVGVSGMQGGISTGFLFSFHNQ